MEVTEPFGREAGGLSSFQRSSTTLRVCAAPADSIR